MCVQKEENRLVSRRAVCAQKLSRRPGDYWLCQRGHWESPYVKLMHLGQDQHGSVPLPWLILCLSHPFFPTV